MPELFASYFFFRRSDQRFIARVMAMQIGKKGVNGPAQKTRQADAMTDAHVQPNIAESRYPTHTGEYTTAITPSSSKNVFTSLHSPHTQRQKFMTFPLSLLNIFNSRYPMASRFADYIIGMPRCGNQHKCVNFLPLVSFYKTAAVHKSAAF